ncbi:leucyl aminopeptidase, partial [bacterium]|nr:leucyl aminopeptidase [bacterium]
MLKRDVQINVNTNPVAKIKTQALVLGVFQDEGFRGEAVQEIDTLYGGILTSLFERGEIRGELKEFHIFHELKEGIERVIVLGCGKRESFTPDTIRFLAAKGARTARKLGLNEASFLLEPFRGLEPEILGVTSAEGLLMGLDRFEVYKTKKRKGDRDEFTQFVLVGDDNERDRLEAGVTRGQILAEGNVIARSIANHPGNKMTPSILADEAQRIAKEYSLGFSVMDEPELEQKGFEGIVSVSKGSDENCKLIKMTYRGRKNSSDVDIAIVGKGLTFDAGGISIKPSANMHLMKYDMCGSAATLGAARIVAGIAPEINVNFYIPSSENLCGSKAYKPGDILNMYGGISVEITNTDAEGRLILADAIALAVEEGAQRIVTTATLTGAVVGALGHWRSGLMCRDPHLKEIFMDAAEECEELVWELPLDKEYKVLLKSPIADLVNSGPRVAGAITAGIFLNEFAGSLPFCHLDIAGTAWVENLPTQ